MAAFLSDDDSSNNDVNDQLIVSLTYSPKADFEKDPLFPYEFRSNSPPIDGEYEIRENRLFGDDDELTTTDCGGGDRELLNLIRENMINIDIELCHEHAQIPKKGTPSSAGFDIFNVEENQYELKPHTTVKFRTGIKLKFNHPDYYAEIKSRSSLASLGIFTIGGIIDNDYRGEIHILLCNASNDSYIIEPGHKIAQLIFQFCHGNYCQFNCVESVNNDTLRGSGGFGSTGK